MPTRVILFTAFMALSFAAYSDTPNIQAGLWETTSTTKIEGAPMEIPEEEITEQQCLHPDDLKEADFLLKDMDDCEVSNLDISSSGMSYSMVCSDDQSGIGVEMDSEVQFMGDRMSGVMNGKMDSPMGELTMTVTHSAKRIGDC